MNLPADEQANPKTVKRPAGCLSGGDQEEPGPFDDAPRYTDEEWETELAYWRPLYEGEKLAGLVRDKDFPGEELPN